MTSPRVTITLRKMTHKIETPFGLPGYLVLAGSRLVGIETPQSDYDYVGALVEPETFRIGLDTYTQGKNHQHGFEQHTFKGEDFEGTVYSLWKLVNMLADCNPTVLSLLFATPIRDDFGINTDGFRRLVVSKKAGHRFMRYMEAQRKSMIGQRAKHVTRQALVDAHGYDTKFAAHTIRHGLQGIEYLEFGSITLPMVAEDRLLISEIRNGEWAQNEVLALAEHLTTTMQAVYDSCTLPDEPDYKALSWWVVAQYQAVYDWREKLLDIQSG